jgi:hypothetical protein
MAPRKGQKTQKRTSNHKRKNSGGSVLSSIRKTLRRLTMTKSEKKQERDRIISNLQPVPFKKLLEQKKINELKHKK